MARCPECRSKFQTLEDESQLHPCPHCGYHPRYDYPVSSWATPFGCDTLWKQDPAPVEDAIERSRRLRAPVIDDALAPAKGIVSGLVLCVPFWAGLIGWLS